MTLSNKRGAALIILIIVITITGLIGAGILSMMGAKQRSYAFQLQSYQAYMLAHAGVEFAIRYACDNKDGFNQIRQYIYPIIQLHLPPGRSIDSLWTLDNGNRYNYLQIFLTVTFFFMSVWNTTAHHRMFSILVGNTALQSVK